MKKIKGGTSGRNGLKDSKRKVRSSLYQFDFVHEGILSLECEPKFVQYWGPEIKLKL